MLLLGTGHTETPEHKIPFKKLRLSENSADSENTASSNDEPTSAQRESGTDNALRFKPLYLLSRWVEPETTTKRVTVAIVQPYAALASGAFL